MSMSISSSVKQPLFALPHSTKVEFLHLLRNLLREASYLPDPTARAYFHSHIVSRFRTYAPRKDRRYDDRLYEGRPIKSADRAAQLLQTGQKALNGLRRANAGYISPLTRVLSMTYGRIGKRRHELLAPYLQPPTPDSNESLNAISSTTTTTGTSPTSTLDTRKPRYDSSGPTISPAIRALAISQKRQPVAKSSSSTEIHHIDVQIPAKNAWGRSMPLKRVRNMKRRAYDGLIAKLLAPLPRREWEQLRHSATNTHTLMGGGVDDGKQIGEVPRRKRARTWDEAHADANDGTYEIEANEQHHSFADRPGKHVLTRRFLQRILGRIYVQCPVMDFDPKVDRALGLDQHRDPVGSNIEATRTATSRGIVTNRGSNSNSNKNSNSNSNSNKPRSSAWKVEWGKAPGSGISAVGVPELSLAEARAFAEIDGHGRW